MSIYPDLSYTVVQVFLDIALVHVVNSYLDSNTLVKSAISKGKLSAQDQATMQGLVLEALRK